MKEHRFSDKSIAVLLALLRIAVGNGGESCAVEDGVDWNEVFELSRRLHISSIIWGGITAIYDNAPETKLGLSSPPYLKIRVKWACSVRESVEKYERHKDVMQKLATFYSSHGLGMMILKGYGLSLNYPVPQYRTSSDIDCFLFYLEEASDGKRLPAWKYGDEVLSAEQDVKIRNTVHHHSVFRYEGVLVENHFDFINVHSHMQNRQTELRLKGLALDKGREILPNVFLPSANMNALFVIRHAATHFTAAAMNFRQIIDWALLIKDSNEEIDWNLFWNDVEMIGMKNFVGVVVNIAVKYLGFDKEIFHLPVQEEKFFDEECEKLTDAVMRDIFFPAYPESPSGIVNIILWKCKRWWANRWKFSMVYKDSLLSIFCSQIIAHLIKPETIKKV